MNAPYTIPTIPQNLSKEETIVQIVDVLDHLNAITQDIFLRVNQRLENNKNKLSNISKRIASASSKVELLKGDKKAKTVFSSSKYPAADVKKDYDSIFKDIEELQVKRHEVKHTKYLSTYEPLTKLQFYHVKPPAQKDSSIPEGLGDVPSDVKCINDVLLFNSGRNLYTDFTLTDSLKGPETIRIREYNTASELGAAPFSISQRSSLQHTNKDNYFYTPKAEELPTLDVPLDLPDLPGIADDLRYETDIGSSIAPSVVNQSQISNISLDLPSIMEITTTEISPPSPPPLENIPEPPVQVPPSKVDFDLDPRKYEKSVKSNESRVLPDTTVDSESIVTEKPPPPPFVTPSGDDSRANLMDAIRKAGGSQKANLKKVSQSSSESNTTISKTTSGDLMADLHSKLMMRRKGISGAKNIEQGGSGTNSVTPDSTLARISSMIPPPAKSEVESSVSTDDEEWND